MKRYRAGDSGDDNIVAGKRSKGSAQGMWLSARGGYYVLTCTTESPEHRPQKQVWVEIPLSQHKKRSVILAVTVVCPSLTYVSPNTLSRSFLSSPTTPSVLPRPGQQACRKLKDVEKNVLQHSDHTVVTPRVGAIARRLFSQKLRTVRLSAGPDQEALPEAPTHPVHRDDPTSMQWTRPTDDPDVYGGILIDGTPYLVRRSSCRRDIRDSRCF